MIKVYAANITGLPDPQEVPELMEGLPKERKEKILRFKQADARRQSLGASLLLMQALKRHDQVLDHIKYGANGKPEIDGICFNLSHSHDIAVCVVSDKRVGCDVEKIQESKEKVAERFFSSKEKAYLDRLTGEVKTLEFFRIWTMKESYLKMTGEGLSFALNRVEFETGEFTKVYRDGILCSCQIQEYEIPGYKLSVCGEETEFAKTIEWL